MKSFLVCMPNGRMEIESHFGGNNIELIPDQLWAVAGPPRATAADVTALLDGGGGNRVFVVAIGEYYGLWDPALWQKLSAWRDMQ